MDQEWRGLLYPTRLPSFHRLPAPPALADRVRWFWIPEWSLGPGRASRQEVLPFPALNLVVEPGGVSLSGPATRRSHRDLTGTGWAVGLLLRPAAVPHLTDDPQALRDREVPYPAPELHAAVSAAMADSAAAGADDGAGRRERAAAAAAAWLTASVSPPDADGALANRLEELIQFTAAVTRVDQAAQLLGISVRTAQRLARRHVGLPPLAMIRRYRLQEAAERLRTDPGVTIADVAADLGYVDHAHLTADFRQVLGFTPSGYRRSARG
ncbi:HTH-type transcriptional activator RhaS [Arthrobacter saudimassiliensis]|uniref:HTH-type transcriptional activator RhaS n=1 Tax=Arthrobacter saudimassiliensis TaxID=1461584 RepID=A0A078MTJ4_9MICC|nr:HTH-type transcriptional activator RhaS [Arthrobacter saudimassiliensis]